MHTPVENYHCETYNCIKKFKMKQGSIFQSCTDTKSKETRFWHKKRFWDEIIIYLFNLIDFYNIINLSRTCIVMLQAPIITGTY